VNEIILLLLFPLEVATFSDACEIDNSLVVETSLIEATLATSARTVAFVLTIESEELLVNADSVNKLTGPAAWISRDVLLT